MNQEEIKHLSQSYYDLHKKYDKLKTQQKEFIKYLKDESKKIYRDNGYRNKICAEILTKYKSIIGDDK